MPAFSRQSAPSFRRVNSFALYLMSLGAMIGLYSLYAKFLVPVIEGPPNIARHVFQAPHVDLPIQQFDRESLTRLFPQDAWEHGDCIVLATKQGLVLFQKFQRVDGGYLEVLPFTLVMKANQESGSDGTEPPTVLRCSKGAKLKFDKPDVDPLAGKSELESAWLVGAVDIYRPASDLKKNDSIEILTSNVQFDRRQIFTIDEVQFAFGNHRGSGRQLSMEFAHQQDSLLRSGFATIAGFKRIELAYLKQLSLSAKNETLAAEVENSSQGQPATAANVPSNGPAASTDTVEITCTGPFVLDLERKTATFNDKVSVLMEGKTNSEILCKRLTVHFEPKDNQSDNHSDNQSKLSQPADSPQLLAGGGWDLERLVAEGSPASFVSQTHAAKVTGDVLGYNVALQEIVAQPLPQSTTPVHIVTADFRFEARQVAYKLKPEGGLGQLIAMGPGNLLRPGNEQDRELFVRWERMLSIEPDQAQQLISVVEGCQIRFDQTTEIKAQELQIWLDELAPENVSKQDALEPGSQYQPDRMTATGNVEMVSPQLNGRTERLAATWIHGDNDQNQQTQRIEPTTTGSQDKPDFRSEFTIARQRHLRVSYSGFPSQRQDGLTNSTAMQPIVRAPAGSISDLRHDPAVRPVDFQEPTTPLKRYEFIGNEMDVKLYRTGTETAIQDLTATGDVTLSEFVDPTLKPNRLPLTITGNQLRYVPQANELARVVVTGLGQQPAMVMTDQFRLLGNQINFDQSANKLWVEGAGEIELSPQVNADSNAQPAGNPQEKRQSAYQSVRLNWASGMVFNGRKVYFEDKVKMFASGVNESGNTIQTLAFGQGVSLELNQQVDFQNTNPQAKQAIEIREVVIVNQVAGSQRVFNLASANLNQGRDANSMLAQISHKTIDPNGLELERQQFQAQQITFQVGTGVMNSKGPGVLMHHGRGESPLLKANNAGVSSPMALNPLAVTGSNQGISLIRVNFDGSANANVNEKRLLIQGNVRTLYASVASFDQTVDPDDPVALPESAVKVKCERLDFTQWTPRDADKPVQELLAAGNAHVTSGSFEATADQIRYNQANDTLVVEGTARSDAQLWHRPKATPNERQHLAAQKIIYRPGDQSYEVQKAMILDLKK